MTDAKKTQFKFGQTNRGFRILNFLDQVDVASSVQESSASGGPYIWVGRHADRMMLSQDDVKAILPFLQGFVATGELVAEEPAKQQAPQASTTSIEEFWIAALASAFRAVVEVHPDSSKIGELKDFGDAACEYARLVWRFEEAAKAHGWQEGHGSRESAETAKVEHEIARGDLLAFGVSSLCSALPAPKSIAASTGQPS